MFRKENDAQSKDEQKFDAERWNGYNSTAIESKGNSFTYTFFLDPKFNLQELLNQNRKSALQLGACIGDYAEYLVKDGWHVSAYDYSDEAVKYLKTKKDLFVKKIDLNKTNNNELEYNNELSADLEQSENVIAVRILTYLDRKALTLLMFSMIDKAKSNTRFFFINYTSNKADPEAFPHNYIPSFFGGRTDAKFIKLCHISELIPESEPHLLNEIFVFKKR